VVESKNSAAHDLKTARKGRDYLNVATPGMADAICFQETIPGQARPAGLPHCHAMREQLSLVRLR